MYCLKTSFCIIIEVMIKDFVKTLYLVFNFYITNRYNGVHFFVSDEKAKHLLSRVKYHELENVERLQGDGQSTKSDCMTSISGSTSSTLSDGISSRRTPVECQKPIYLNKWLNRMECGSGNTDDIQEKDDLDIHSDNFVNLERYLPFVPRNGKMSSACEFNVGEQTEPSFSVLESVLMDNDDCSRGHGLIYDFDSAYSSPITDFDFHNSDLSGKSELLPTSNLRQDEGLASVLGMVDGLFKEINNECLPHDENSNNLDYEIDISKLL